MKARFAKVNARIDAQIALASWMPSMPCVVVLRGELGSFGPWEHVARERPEVSIA